MRGKYSIASTDRRRKKERDDDVDEEDGGAEKKGEGVYWCRFGGVIKLWKGGIIL